MWLAEIGKIWCIVRTVMRDGKADLVVLRALPGATRAAAERALDLYLAS